MVFAGAMFLILVAVYLLIKGWDVRLVLFAAGLAIASLKAFPWAVLDAFAKTVGNGVVMGVNINGGKTPIFLRVDHKSKTIGFSPVELYTGP